MCEQSGGELLDQRIDAEDPGRWPGAPPPWSLVFPIPRRFDSGRDFSACIGLVPEQHSSGGKEKLGSISKQGDRYLRSLFTIGALAVIRYAKIHGTAQSRPVADIVEMAFVTRTRHQLQRMVVSADVTLVPGVAFVCYALSRGPSG